MMCFDYTSHTNRCLSLGKGSATHNAPKNHNREEGIYIQQGSVQVGGNLNNATSSCNPQQQDGGFHVLDQ